MTNQVFTIRGMDCAEEVVVLRAALEPLVGVGALSFDILGGKLTVEHDPATVAVADLLAAVRATGMEAEVWSNTKSTTTVSTPVAWNSRTLATVGSGLLIATGFVTHAVSAGWHSALGESEGVGPPLASRLVYVAAAIAGGWFVAPKAWRSLRRARPDMNLLMAVAVLGAIAIGQFMEAATVAFLFAVSLALESWSVDRARRAIAALMSLTPDEATVLRADGTEANIPVADVAIGSTVVVRPGQKIPLDGKIARGETTVNQAPITGESASIAKGAGHEVYAGTINQDGAIEIVTTKPAGDTTLARIVRMVGDAQSNRSASEQWVDRFASYYTPAVMILALLVMLLPPLLLGAGWAKWFYQGLVLLVIACPCALVISTPVSIVAALTSSARRGVLVKGGPYLEASARLVAVALDKTGTLTEGRPQVSSITPWSGHTADEVLQIAAALEARSSHPLAQAIMREVQERILPVRAADDFQALHGRGATATLDGRTVWLGSHRLLEERGQETPEMHQLLLDTEASGASVIVIGEGDHVCGTIALADRIRPQARQAVAELRAAGIRRVVMLTGDNQGTAEAIAGQAGVDEVHAGLLPADKLTRIEQLVREHRHVAMIGDGVNDAPAMARASMGIAMGAVGTDAALETADVALMTDDLRAVTWLIQHARRTLRTIRQNIFLSLGVKILFVALSLAGYASLWSAIAADTGASLAVIFNGLRLLRAPQHYPSKISGIG